MDELYKKIEALRDMVKGLTSKPGQASLVPALKLPSPKPLSLPPVSSSAPTQLPGVAVPSNKDPKAVAAQLKNPRPKKPKMEMLKSHANGQWYLDKDDSGTMMPDGDC